MSTKHTPGPWHVETVPTQVGHCHKIMPLHACIYVDGHTLPHHAANLEPQIALANAKLIAAAPDLLHALSCIVQRIHDDEFMPGEYVQMADEAIAKATS